MPRSIVAIPLIDERGTIGVLEVLDKRSSAAFSLRDIELAGVFAGQATVAIRASRIERDMAPLLRAGLAALAEPAEQGVVDELVAAAMAELDQDDDGRLWAIADRVARLRTADPGELDLLVEILDVVVRRAERRAEQRRRSSRARGPR